MEELTKKEMREFIRKHINKEVFDKFSIAHYKENFGLYPDGSYKISLLVGLEVECEERELPLVVIPVPYKMDINNLEEFREELLKSWEYY